MWDKIESFFESTWNWIKAVWNKHDDALKDMVTAIIPMVIDVAFRADLSGEQKKKAIVDAIVDNAQAGAGAISISILNEAIEIAANRYNIQIGKLTVDKIDAAREAALQASRDYANGKLKISGTEAEEVGLSFPLPVMDNLITVPDE